MSRKSAFTLSWSHYVLLLTVKDPNERNYYEIESTDENWSLIALGERVLRSTWQARDRW